jgi:hypothetical protein
MGLFDVKRGVSLGFVKLMDEKWPPRVERQREREKRGSSIHIRENTYTYRATMKTRLCRSLVSQLLERLT